MPNIGIVKTFWSIDYIWRSGSATLESTFYYMYTVLHWESHVVEQSTILEPREVLEPIVNTVQVLLSEAAV